MVQLKMIEVHGTVGSVQDDRSVLQNSTQPVLQKFPSISPDVILCGWLGLKHQLTN